MYRPILIALLTACAVILAALLGLLTVLGAHPFWSVQVALIGASLGALIAMFLGWSDRIGIAFLVGVVVSVLGLVAALRGKAAFAASYAEDHFAGSLWYFGWIAACIGITLALAAVAIRASGQAGRRSAPPPL
jgi:hypothetical protein